ncbi:lactosylceramide 4-alpha-galactosyltransferase-like [Heterodontus francisci]|uniref:lactosylceramide 4-alpha-galactosyltransferase-like n=1 Tax=Heterodontus francisci TaxID=7792 RepID=UPI00355BBC34
MSQDHSKSSEEKQKQQRPLINRYVVPMNTTKINSWCKLCVCILISLKLVYLITLMLCYKGGPQSRAVKYRLPNHIKCPSIDFNYSRNSYHLTEDNTTIFFVEASDQTNPTFLSMCSIESAARSHPRAKIVLFMKSFSAMKSAQTLGISLLNCFPNVEIRPLDLKDLFADTPLSLWYSRLDQWWQPYLIPTIADACRLVIMWKYGGIYLDTDIIVFKNLRNLTNSIGREQQYLLNSAFLAFDQHHDFIGHCLMDFVEHFNGWIWGHQGPQLVTRVLKKWCQKKSITKIRQCKGVRMLPPEAFYPIRWQDWKKYFEVMSKSETQQLLKNSYAVHIWNKKSHGTPFRIGSKVMIDQLSSAYCPVSYKIMSWQENV